MEAKNLTRMAANFSFLDVTGGDGTARFQVRFHGETVGRVYGSTDPRGKYLDEIIPPEPQTPRACALSPGAGIGQPVYTVHDVTDRNGRLVSTTSGCFCPYSHSDDKPSIIFWHRWNSSALTGLTTITN